MSSRSPRLYLDDMRQACDDILQFTQGIDSAEMLENDRKTFLAVLRCLEVLGEAARQMPRHFREKHPEIPWREIGNLRNVIAHEYFGLEPEIIWDIVKTQVSPLFEKVKMLAAE